MAIMTKKEQAYNLLKDYKGYNPFLFKLSYNLKNIKGYDLNNFDIDFVINNINYIPKFVNKIITITDWYGEYLKEKWNIKYIPLRLYVGYVIGETDTCYACYIKYSQTQEKPILTFLSKKGIVTEMFVEPYNDMVIDFEKYDILSKNKDIKIKDFQKDAVKFLLKRKKAILADSQGYGKTIETIISALESGAKKILIICPASLKSNWKNELTNYVNQNEIEIINGNKWKDNKFIIANYDILDNFYTLPLEIATEKIYKEDENGKIISITQTKWAKKPKYDDNGNIIEDGIPKMKITTNKKKIEEAMNNSQLFNSNFDLVIIDEVHKLCNSTSGRYKIIKDFLKRTNPEFIFLLSGTPITNRPSNYYNILSLLKAEITKDYNYYIRRYCNGKIQYLKGEKLKWTQIFLKNKKKTYSQLTDDEKKELNEFLEKYAKHVWLNNGSSNLDELKEKTKHLYLRRLTSEIKDMVEKKVYVLRYDLSEEETIKYNQLWSNYISNSNNENLEQYRQVIEGSVARQYLAELMIPYTIELAENILDESQKLIIMCTFDIEIEMLKKHFKDSCVVYNGKMTTKKKDEAVNKFKNDNNIKIFIGNIIAAGVGLNLQVAHDLIFNSFSYVSGENLQAEDRIYRQTQTSNCTVYYQLFTNTFSEEMYDFVLSKHDNINQIIKKENDK